MQDVLNETITLIATTGIKAITNDIVEAYIKPKLRSINYSHKECEIDLIGEKFIEYIDRSYHNYLYMNTIVFRNQQKTIDDLYIPLTVKKAKAIVDGSVMDKDDVEICIDEYKDEFIPNYRKVLLVDSAGMGKSTIMKFLYLKSIINEKGIPILIELRKLDENISIIEFIMNEINGIKVYFNENHIMDMIERGDFIFFFDGYDEINNNFKAKITNNIRDFISKAGNNCFIISSRDENELNSFGDFQRFDIKRLEDHEVYELICKYDNNGKLSQELIEKLKTENNLKIINEFLDNPLMASLLYKAFEYKKKIPYKKHIFYRQVYDALFEEHDMSKGGAYVHDKKSKLDIEDFHKVIRYIAFSTLNSGIIYEKEKLIEIINHIKNKIIGIDFRPQDFIYDLTHSVPFFIKEGNQYRWSHKSFQDYFAACYICFDAKENSKIILEKISCEDKIDKYYNILDFCYDIDYEMFAKYIIYPVIQNLINFEEGLYKDDSYINYNKDDIYIRKMILFSYNYIKVKKLSESEEEYLWDNNIEGLDLLNYMFEEEDLDYGHRVVTTCQDYVVGIMSNEKNNITTLFRLLDDKNSNLIDSNLAYRMKINRDLFISIKPGEYKLEDSIDNELNKLNLFKSLNEYFIKKLNNSRNSHDIRIPNYEECIKLKNKIEKELEAEKNNSYLDLL